MFDFGSMNRGSSVQIQQEDLPIAVVDALHQEGSDAGIKSIRRFGQFPNLQFEIQFENGKSQNYDMDGGSI